MTRTRLNRIFLGGVLVLSSLISVTSRQHQHAHNAMAAPSLSLLLLLSAAPSSFLPIVSAAREKTKTHYEVLQIPQSASLKDIKKAYRKLAVQHHPDRNKGNEEEATIKFREISEAYQVLSDEKERREYDKFIKYGGDSSGQYKRSTGDYRSGSHKDPFAQFNDLFENDPFFKEAFKPLEDLFNTVNWADFDGSNNGGNNNRASGNSRRQGNKAKDVDESKNTAGGWFWNIAKEFMPNVNIQTTTSSTTNYGGTTSHSSTSRSYGSGNNRQQRRSRSSSSSTYTSKSTRMTIENGQRVLIQSMEKDGNKIEEKYVGDTLVERTINGVKEDIGRIGQGGEF